MFKRWEFMKNDKNVNCFDCEFLYVTWDKNFPRGCRAMNFKTKEMPSSNFLRNTGYPCPLFKEVKNK